MAKRRKSSKKSQNGIVNLLVFGAIVIAGIGALLSGGTNDSSSLTTQQRRSTELAQTAQARDRNNSASNNSGSSTVRNTSTPRATRTPRPTATPNTTAYARQNANLRTCARIADSCPVSGAVAAGDALKILDTVTGDEFQGSNEWYLVELNGDELYIHSALLTDDKPATTSSNSNSSSSSSSGSANTSSSTLMSTPPPQPTTAGATCPTDRTTCDSLTCAEAYACLAAGRVSLDRDKDGVPCENVCPGGN